MTESDPRAIQLLDDLLLHADAVARLVRRGKPAFDQDEFLRYAGEDLLVRLGEVVARLDRKVPGFVEAHAELELRNLKDTRNFVAHGYDVVDFEIIWEILADHVPVVSARVRELLES
ncbi:HepT-like ribonuclease domain-containing protein [Promicromonospora sp. CA-289599]|uniref:HepT-like ribonuclease domain-containing protein n=1 Tax=Promicromonospora sp. CA-289599 TaxID=3240014 RepID=UPI003D92D985